MARNRKLQRALKASGVSPSGQPRTAAEVVPPPPPPVVVEPEPAPVVVEKPKKVRYVREKKSERPVVKVPLPPRTKSFVGKLMSKNLALPPKDERLGFGA